MRIRNAGMLGELIREERRRLGMSQTALAEKIGASRQWVYEVERGKDRAEVGLVLRALDALGLVLNVVSPPDLPGSSPSGSRVGPLRSWRAPGAPRRSGGTLERAHLDPTPEEE